MIDLPVAKISSAEGGWRMVPIEHGPSRRHPLAQDRRADGQTLVEFRPLTGRTHQIRVHAARGLGAAIVGDPVYLDDAAAECPMLLPRLAAGRAARTQGRRST